jgi:hypothetical protein
MLLISYLLKRKKENFLLNFAIHRHNEGVVTGNTMYHKARQCLGIGLGLGMARKENSR